MKTDNITNGHGTVEDMNNVSSESAEKTQKDFKKEGRKTGYPTPEYVPQKPKQGNGGQEGDKKAIKIAHGQGYVVDFETWVSSKIRETKSDNK